MSSAISAPDLLSAPAVRWRSARLTPHDEERARAMLSPDERLRLDELTAAGEITFLGGRLLLRDLVSELLRVEPVDVALEAFCADCGGPHGRPTLAGGQLNLSLSRTADMIVAVASRDAAVGIDVETVAGGSERLDAVEALTGIRSLQHWTRVEAVLKADGRGLRVDPAEVRVRVRGSRVDAAIGGSRVRYRLLDVAADEATVGSVAVAL